jgi:hypothetical protein
MQIKKIEELSIEELHIRMAAIYELCHFKLSIAADKETFMQRQWTRMAQQANKISKISSKA